MTNDELRNFIQFYKSEIRIPKSAINFFRIPNSKRCPVMTRSDSTARSCNCLSGIVRELLQELKMPRDREILLRFYVQEADKEEICSELDVSPEHFNRVLFRAKNRFRKLLLEEERKGRITLVE